MRSLALVFIVQLLLCGAAFAQTEKPGGPRAAKAATRRKSPAPRRARQDETARAARRVWLFMSVGSIFDTNITHDEQSVNAFGVVPSVGLHVQNNAETPSFEADYEVALHRYTGTKEFNRVSQSLTTAYRRQLGRGWSARTTGEVSLKGSSEDRDVNNQYALEQQLQYRFNSANRVQVFAAYRLKRYPLIDQGKNAIDPYIGGKFQQKWKGGREWQLSYRYDKNRAQDPKDFYVRRTYEAQFSTPLFRARRDLLTLEARYSPRLYARQIKVNGVRVPRRDRRWVFAATYERPLRQDVRLGLNYRYENRDSNDVEKKFKGHVFGVTFGFKWWR
jgi:hypothetical protein